MKQRKKHNIKGISLLAMSCFFLFFSFIGCKSTNTLKSPKKSTLEMLGDPVNYPAICYGGYRQSSRDLQPTIAELKEDMLILSAMGIKFIRTYNVALPHAANVLQAIQELKSSNPSFEMYVMLGAWIDCENAWTDKKPNHQKESPKNTIEINRAVELTNKYPDIVKILAVGNEAMVKWAEAYYVEPAIILKWVTHLQELKSKNDLPSDLLITSSDNFASWGGGSSDYHNDDLEELIKNVDYLSIHTYPMHDTHYNPEFWGVYESELSLSKTEQLDLLIERSVKYAQDQYAAVQHYLSQIGVTKPIHIGETGWASFSDGLYGPEGSMACDEYKQGVYYQLIREWTDKDSIACFFFEAFDESWKDAGNPNGSENYFGLFTIEGKAKYPLWNQVDENTFNGLTRNGNNIEKTYKGTIDSLLKNVEIPTLKNIE